MKCVRIAGDGSHKIQRDMKNNKNQVSGAISKPRIFNEKVFDFDKLVRR